MLPNLGTKSLPWRQEDDLDKSAHRHGNLELLVAAASCALVGALPPPDAMHPITDLFVEDQDVGKWLIPQETEEGVYI